MARFSPRRRFVPALLCAAIFTVWIGADLTDRPPPQPPRGPSLGPPPPGYWRITGEPVPDWQPQSDPAPRSGGGAATWQPMGPRPILSEYWSGDDDASGRVVSIAPHPTDPQTCYIASASGGIWKTTDGGSNWTPLTDELSTLNHGAVAIDPSNPQTIYAGTGEYTVQSTGDGLFRSLDGGATWTKIATAAQVGTRCSRVMINPANPQVIHVTGSAGYIRSTNGGAAWSTRLSGAASDVAINPVNPQTLYVARHSDGVYRSLDGGTTLTKLAGGLPVGSGRIVLGLSAANPSVVYAAFTDDGDLVGLYRSADGGTSWSLLPATPNFPSPQAWYSCFLAVDPSNENTLMAGGVFPSYAPVGVVRSTNGGTSWTEVSISAIAGQLHPDMHAVAFGPGGVIWCGNDGGVWKSTDNAASWINLNATLTLTQNYQIALHPTDAAKLMGGTQDNGTVGRDLATDQWPQVLEGDGGFAAYDFATPTRRYTTYIYLSIYRFNGALLSNITGPWSGDPRNFIAPLIISPHHAQTLFGGTDRVWRTTNAAATIPTWTAISPTTVGGGGTLNTLAQAASDAQVMYTGSSNGPVYVTANGGANWNNRSTGLPAAGVTDIVIHPTNASRAYVSYALTTGGRIYSTTNQGVSWTAVGTTLPTGVASRALAVDWRFAPPHLYCGAGSGVYSSRNGGASWTKDGTDLPNVTIGDLQIHPATCDLIAGTYGRGAWRLRLPADCNSNATPDDLEADCDADGTLDACETPADCNTNGTHDGCDVIAATSLDCNLNNTPDECMFVAPGTRGDVNIDGAVDGDDVGPFIAVLQGLDTDPSHQTQADVNGDGAADCADVAPFIAALLGP